MSVSRQYKHEECKVDEMAVVGSEPCSKNCSIASVMAVPGSPGASLSPSPSPMTHSMKGGAQLARSAEPLHIGKRRERRLSSFNSTSSPCARRRSFMSKSMLEHDRYQSYELSSFTPESSYGRIPSFSISLSESQGFIWNQDLFASSYQQVRAGLNPDEQEKVNVIDIVVGDGDEDVLDVDGGADAQEQANCIGATAVDDDGFMFED